MEKAEVMEKQPDFGLFTDGVKEITEQTATVVSSSVLSKGSNMQKQKHFSSDTMQSFLVDPEFSVMECHNNSPVQNLYAAIVERAIRDVISHDPWERRLAIEWLEHKTQDCCISYQDCISAIPLSVSTIQAFQRIIDEVKQLLRNQTAKDAA